LGWQHLDTVQYNSAGQERGLNPRVGETLSFKYFDVEPLFSEYPTLTKLEATPDELATPLVGVTWGDADSQRGTWEWSQYRHLAEIGIA